MRAAVYDAFSQDPDNVVVREVAEPKLFPGTVLLEVRAAAVNPVDWKLMAGYLDPVLDTQFPVIPGWDVSGVVIGLGTDTPEFELGDEVLAYARKDTLHAGTFAERIAVPVRAVTRKPPEMSWEAAAGLPLAGGTAIRAIDALGDLAGATILIHGAAGGVGSLAVQIAVARGARVIGTASERNHSFLRELGAEPVAHGDGLVDRIRALSASGVDAVADFVGGQLQTTRAVLRDGGRHVSTADDSVTEHGGRVIWVRVDGEETARLVELVERGILHVEIAGTYGLAEVPEAFRASQTGRTRGKLVILPQR